MNNQSRITLFYIWGIIISLLVFLQYHSSYAQDSTTIDIYVTDEDDPVYSTTPEMTTQDPDQCAFEVLNECDTENGHCTNTDSGYTCECNEGYTLASNGFDCENTNCPNTFTKCPGTNNDNCVSFNKLCDTINDCGDWSDENALSCGECSESQTRCDNAYCIDTSLFCDETANNCPDNFDETSSLCDGSCLSLDPLDNGKQTSPAQHRRRYLNNQVIEFVCNDGFTLVGDSVLTCTDESFGDNLPRCYSMCNVPDAPTYGTVSTNEMVDHGDTIEFACSTGLVLEPATPTIYTCNDGSLEYNTRKHCIDIDECTQDIPCGSNAQCTNTFGSYSCECNDGFEDEGEGQGCEDIDECARGTDTCSDNALCTDTTGSYTCECNDGYRGDGFECIEILYFDYGSTYGDSSLRETFERNTKALGEYISPSFTPPNGFPVGSEFLPKLYFTENGIVILVNNNDDIVSYTYPPTSGFVSGDRRNIIAPFWADGDMSTDIGDVLYQEYVSGDEDAQLFLPYLLDRLTELTTAASITLPTDFTPTWALKVTWLDIAQRPATVSTSKRNTFQATIMTDGLFSFGLFFYEEGDMSWDASLEDPADATIGYNVDAENPTNFFTAGQYRPDEDNGNTGQRGQWVFRLDTNTEDTINPRKWCNDWYDQDKTESFSTTGLGTCPCTFRQIVLDGRYVYNPVISLSQDGLGRGSDVDNALANYEISTSVFSTIVTLLNERASYAVCFHSSTFNFFFSGTQCCYRINDLALLEGYNGIGASSFVFKYAYNFGFFGIFSQYINHIAYDIMPRYYCCSVSQDESLCEKYVERRPQSSCIGYTPPLWSWMFGDPHITTSDGYQYTFNGHGEFLCSDVDSGLFQLQCRMSTPISDENVEATIFSAFTGVHTMTSNTFVQFTLNEDGTDFDIVVNGSETVTTSSLGMGPYISMSDPSFSISIQNVSNINRVSASWGNISFSVALQEKMLDVVLQFTEEYKGRTSGLFGIWNDNTSDDLCSPTMECLDTSTTLAESDIFETSNSWRLSEEDSMFVYPSGMSYEDFNDESFQPLFLDELKATADSQLLQEAEDRCGLNRQCLFDALATKNVDIGVNSKLTEETNLENEMVLENIPPVIDQIVDASSQYLVGQSQLNIMVNSTVTLTIEASDENDDTLTYGLEFNIPGSSIDSQSGVFTWTPTTTDVASLTFIVSDGTHATSAVMNIRICSCYNGGDCDFNYLLDGYDITDTNFVVVQCDCLLAWTGSDCSEDFDACAEEPCYPGVICRDNVAPEANATCADCPPGLVGNGFKCYDYDECAAGSDQDESALFCEHPELCTNTLGSYECACRSGYELLFNMKECRDIDECDLQTDSCSAQAQCENTDGGYNCTCNDGYLGDGNACDDINECQQNVYPCDAHADCNNIQGSFFCVCIDGYTGTGETCTDVDECRQGTYECDPNADCINTEGSYRCTCSQGFEGNSTYCEDIDECIARPLDCHPMSDCTNTIGSYMCTCPDGYRGDGSTCFDIDECAESDGICLEFEECFNTDGSYGCRCITGYDRATEGADCTDVDECVPVNGRTPCSSNGICNNIIGSYSCDCVQGYFGDGLDCLDIDECSSEVDECDQVCTNTVGNYTCGCNDGFELGSDERSCIPLENSTCPDDTNPCDASATCIINKDGNQQCYCDKGYTLVNMGCENVNECDLNQDDCDTTNGNCIDTEGSYGCACADGYELLQDLRTCTDIDECTESNTCVATAQCSNSDGSFTCECLAGYTGSSCSNIDECTSDSSDCHENANCEDTEGSYRCTCQDGYTGNGQTCIDVNECLSSEVCHTFATCSNTDGSFTCTCISGYSGDGIDSCIDNNECNDSPCDANADCTNLPGTYTCACMTGHRGDGFVSCINIDECTEQPNICPEQATCTDTDGSYECECNDGFVTDGSDCTDVDECQLNTDNCDVNSMCNNTIGSYTCRCNRGYVSEANARAGTCMDYDECFYNIDDCSASGICNNNIGSYSCECKPGFDGNGEICTDTDECDQVTNPCNLDNNERCVNTQGSFNCVCQTSYFNRSGECLLVVAKTLNAKFLYIKGLLTTMFANTLDLDQVSIELANDIDTLFSQSNLAENYFGAVTENINIDNSTDGVEVEFTLSFDDQYNVTDAMVLEAFFNGLTGNTMDILEPNSQIIRDNTDVVETVVNPCDEGTDDCTERLFEECVFVSNEQFTCQTCSSGYMLSDDESTCVDIDECDQNPCGNNELCTNVAGGFSCSCTDGYVSSSSGCVVAVSFRGELRVVEINQVLVAWDPELEDPSSDLFMEYAELMCSIISNAYNSLSSAFYGCTVIGFKEGSIIAVYQVQFFTNSTMNGEELLELLLNETDNNNILSDENNNITLDVTHDVVGEDLPIVCEEGYCYNSGSCSINSLLEKECSCVNNFSGVRCEECPSNYCENGGNCSTSSGVASCSCPLYFSGSQCQTISCPDDYCQNGGSCLITIQNPVPSCNCPLHFSGSLCEIVSCPGDYCQNGGTCSITVENPVPTCSCVSDYSGDQCQTSSDDSLVLILIIISAIAGLTLFVILIFCCMLFVANRRRERHQQAVKHFTGQHDRGMVARNADYYEGLFGYSRQPFFHETDSVSSHGDDSRLSHLAQVLRNAPHLNNKMRESSLSGSEFSRPYVATGMEARDLDLEEMERNRGSRITTTHNFSARDPQRQSTSRNFYF